MENSKEKLEAENLMSKQIRILAIDDERHVRILLEYNLKLNGFEVYLAESGREGLKLAREKQPDLILLDWMMPETDGAEVLASLKNDKATRHIPVFMMTVKKRIDDINRAFDLGADDYITKPFNEMQLADTIRIKLKQYAEKKQLPQYMGTETQ